MFHQFEAKVVTGRLWSSSLLLLFLFIPASRAPLAGQFDQNDIGTLSNKTVATPRSLEAFTGTLITIKPKGKLITLETNGGKATEIFSCRNGPAIRTVAGQKMKFKALKPGMMVVVYYSSKKGRRSVKDVLVLKAKPAKKEAESASPES